jgi:hypothetical protein
VANLKLHTIALTTASDGTLTVYSTKPVTGFIERIHYTPDGTVPLDNTADITITAKDSGGAILTITNQAQAATDYAPRQATHSVTGVAALFAAGGLAVNDRIPIATDFLKVVVAQGGNAKKGTLYFYVS